MSFFATIASKRVTNFALAFMLVISTLAASVPFIFSQQAAAVAGSEIVYQGIPSTPSVAYPSLGYNAESVKEFGDRLVLAGSNRVLDNIKVNFTSWACESGAWNTADCVSGEDATFTHPVTVNVYEVGVAGTVGNLIATKEQIITAKYRPSTDSPICTGGKWYDAITATCYNGISFDVDFDFSAQDRFLPSEVIATVAFNTSKYGSPALPSTGPYDSLNVSAPTTAPEIGADYGGTTASTYVDSVYPGHTAGLKHDTSGTHIPAGYYLGMNISATSIAGPALLFPQNNEVIDTDTFTFDWENVTGATSYEFQNSKISGAVNPDGGLTNVHFQGTSPISQLASSGAGEVTRWWQVRAVFADSSKSEWSVVWNMSIDMTDPTVALDSPSHNAVVKGASVTQSWTTTSTDVAYYTYRSWNDAAGTSPRWEENFPATSKTATNVADSTYWWQVQAVDYAGNESGWTPLWKLTVDSTAPDVSLTYPLDGDVINGSVGTPIDVRGTVTDANPHHYFVRVERQTGPSTWTSVYSHTTNELDSFTNQTIYNWTPSVDGTYRITLEARDAAGGTSSSGNKDSGSVASVIVVVDTAAPVVTIDPQTSTAGNTPTITGTVDDIDADLEAIFNGDTYVVVNNAGVWSFTAPVPLANGTYSFSITASDAAGNDTTETADVIVAVVTPVAATPETPAGTVATTVTPATINPAAFAAILGATTDTTTDETTTNNEGESDVEGATDTLAAVDTDATDGDIFGLAWYWWLLILAAIAAITSWIVAAVRRRNNSEA